MQGFFPSSVVEKTAPPSLIPKCGACGLYQHCHTPKMPYSGKGRRKVLIVGELPGKAEDREGEHFVGNSGQRLREVLSQLDVDLDEDCWMTNALICRPEGGRMDNDAWIGYCRPNLMKTVQELQPVVIILLGSTAVKSLIGGIWRSDDFGGIARWVGWVIPNQRPNSWVCPTYHPSFLIAEDNDILNRLFLSHLEKAFRKADKGRPWKTLPEYDSQIEVILDTDKAAKAIRQMIRAGGEATIDYETNCLKPEYPGSHIICAAISWEGPDGSTRTIAFPFHGEAIHAWCELLESDLDKSAANMKFEHRWSFKKLGIWIKRWVWDTMVAMHAIDNRPGITGLKFQAYILLGMLAYDDHIKKFLGSVGDGKLNRVKSEVDLRQLCFYCGFDTLAERLVKKKQMRILTRLQKELDDEADYS